MKTNKFLKFKNKLIRQIFLATLILTIYGCNNDNNVSADNRIVSQKPISIDSRNTIKQSANRSAQSKEGFLHIDLASIYHNGKSLVILNKAGDTVYYFKEKRVIINGKPYEIIDDEHLYKHLLSTDHYDAEYGLFIMKAKDLNDKFYLVKINGKTYLIDKRYKDILEFKTPEQYVMAGSPYLYKRPQNPLRKAPNDSAEIIKDYMKYTYVPIEIKGDWLKVKDDKECVPGEGPSQKDIIGWVRWRKNGKIILDIRFGC